jgi:hypothetical protein
MGACVHAEGGRRVATAPFVSVVYLFAEAVVCLVVDVVA